ncbi:MAG TPA: hypothetical protein V6D29_01595 [Leptolyngbyaceae cyanobacterium]
MAESKPLEGIELVDCAKANAEHGVAIAAHQCGFGTDTDQFMISLKSACKNMGIEVNALEDLITGQQRIQSLGGVEVAPDTPSEL